MPNLAECCRSLLRLQICDPLLHVGGTAEQRAALKVEANCPMAIAEQPVLDMVGIDFNRNKRRNRPNIEKIVGGSGGWGKPGAKHAGIFVNAPDWTGIMPWQCGVDPSEQRKAFRTSGSRTVAMRPEAAVHVVSAQPLPRERAAIRNK